MASLQPFAHVGTLPLRSTLCVSRMSPSRPADHYRALVGAGAVSAALKFGKWGTSLGTSSASSASSFPSSSSHRRMRMSRVRQGPRTALQAQTAYRWEQGDAVDQELRIMLPVPQSTTAKDIDFKVCERFIRVGLKNLMDQVLLEGELWSSVDVEDTYFELEDSEDSEDSESGRFLKVYLAKCHVETWEEVLKPCWTWEPAGRHNEEIRIHVPVGNDVKASDLDFRLSYGRIRLACNDKPLLEGDLWGQVDPTDCDWMIENHKGQRCVVVSLGKLHVRENWDRLLKTEEGKGGWETFQPGSRKDVDMAVLGSLEYVNTLLHQKDVEYAKEYLDHILPPEQEAEKTGEQR